MSIRELQTEMVVGLFSGTEAERLSTFNSKNQVLSAVSKIA